MKIFILSFLILLSFSALAQDAVIAVGKAEQDKDRLVVDDPEQVSLNGAQKNLATELTDLIKNDFIFYKHKFNSIEYSDKGKNSYTSPNAAKWKESGITYYIASQISGDGSGIEAKVKAFSVLTGKEIFNKSFKLSQSSLRNVGHQISDGIYRAITGKPSIFSTKIVFVSDRTTRGKDILKELYIMDFDGRRVEKLTNFNSVIISPSIAPDNSKIIFSLIASHTNSVAGKVKRTKNIDLKSLDLRTKHFSTVSDKPGINSGAIYTHEGSSIYFTLSYSGNADIYEMNLNSGAQRKITTHYGDDVDPSITKDGTLMAFLSNRPGRAHIYTMDPRGQEKNIKRISFVGQFNATPRFSPDGREIVFTSWVDNNFDLYRIGSGGDNLVRLTKDYGSNEEPSFSPDGEFIVFTSKRIVGRNKAVQDIYIMNREGEILGQLTQNFGRCFTPQWTNILN